MKIECGNCGAVESDSRMYLVSKTCDYQKLSDAEYNKLIVLAETGNSYVFLCKKCYVRIRKKRGEEKWIY